jgi:hypothetical protein
MRTYVPDPNRLIKGVPWREYTAKKNKERRKLLKDTERCSNCTNPVFKKVIEGQLKVFTRCLFCLKRMAGFQQEYKERIKNEHSKSERHFATHPGNSR